MTFIDIYKHREECSFGEGCTVLLLQIFSLAGKVMSCAGTWLVHLESNTLSWFGSLTAPTEVVLSDWMLNYIGSFVLKLDTAVSKDILIVRWSASAEHNRK